MSDENKNEVDTSCEVDTSYCASCGVAEVDDIKLVPCDDCDLVKYCSDKCQHNHKSEHEEDCKKRAAELREELLFKLPESRHLGDCPICSLPLPLDPTKSGLFECCSKTICVGCFYTNKEREMEMGHVPSCPFCREPLPDTDEECEKRRMKRIELNDPVAMVQQGGKHIDKGEYQRAFEYYTKAAELGDAGAHYQLSVMYQFGHVVEKEEGKEEYHLEEAAIAGHPEARHNLGCAEIRKGNVERAMKHVFIAALQGEDESIKVLMEAFKDGLISKEVLEAAFRAHKAAVDATKSPQRDQAEAIKRSE